MSTKENGGRSARVGSRFHKEMEKVQAKKLKNGTGIDKVTKKVVSIEKLTNMIAKNKYWEGMKEDLINANEQEIIEHGK